MREPAPPPAAPRPTRGRRDVARPAEGNWPPTPRLLRSAPKHLLIVPGQQKGRRPLLGAFRKADLATLEVVVGLAVVELFLQSATDLEAVIGSHRDITLVEEPVDVG